MAEVRTQCVPKTGQHVCLTYQTLTTKTELTNILGIINYRCLSNTYLVQFHQIITLITIMHIKMS
jgi:hypothetical protein